MIHTPFRLDDLRKRPLQVALTRRMQVSQVMEAVIDQIGPARILQSSFSAADEYLRRLNSLKKKGLVLDVSIILDFKATNKTVKLWPFLRRVADRVSLADNHSKVILLDAPASGRRVAVLSSQNLTRGNRLESAAVIEDAAVFASLEATLRDVIDNQSLSLTDVYTQRIKYPSVSAGNHPGSGQ